MISQNRDSENTGEELFNKSNNNMKNLFFIFATSVILILIYAVLVGGGLYPFELLFGAAIISLGSLVCSLPVSLFIWAVARCLPSKKPRWKKYYFYTCWMLLLPIWAIILLYSGRSKLFVLRRESRLLGRFFFDPRYKENLEGRSLTSRLYGSQRIDTPSVSTDVKYLYTKKAPVVWMPVFIAQEVEE